VTEKRKQDNEEHSGQSNWSESKAVVPSTRRLLQKHQNIGVSLLRVVICRPQRLLTPFRGLYGFSKALHDLDARSESVSIFSRRHSAFACPKSEYRAPGPVSTSRRRADEPTRIGYSIGTGRRCNATTPSPGYTMIAYNPFHPQVGIRKLLTAYKI
jgi:hypothetical protein